MIRSYRDLKVWERSIELAMASHTLAKKLPRSEEFGLGIQIRRAAASIPANIAEGHGRVHRGDYVHHLSIARGSLKPVFAISWPCLSIAAKSESVSPEARW